MKISRPDQSCTTTDLRQLIVRIAFGKVHPP